MTTIKVYVTDETFSKALTFAASKAPKLGDRMIDEQIEFVWEGDAFVSSNASVTVFNEQGVINGLKKNWTHSRSATSKLRPSRSSYTHHTIGVDHIEQAVRFTGSCDKTIDMLVRWTIRWQILLETEQDKSQREELQKQIDAHTKILSSLRYTVHRAKTIMLEHGIVHKTGIVNCPHNSLSAAMDDDRCFEYAWVEECARKKAEWESRRDDIDRLMVTFCETHPETAYEVFSSCVAAKTAYNRYKKYWGREWITGVVKAYATVLCDPGGVDLLKEDIALEEQQKAEQKAKRDTKRKKS